ncbi:predicted protein [Histoplasma mississippiense (nom. inval.)]|uniref:predicted protein n=1 Tax=Ajellomyces capsulatus (strain NAm1 / WU24) TaxID=2059318 RepID=UPI000157B7D0|nr:predicted protein [Histoplasma mississippiense (nom. inval.)]EDN03472.1 predicted protein [Histoplasma mississippiense (nom. inval.)]
MTSIIIVPAKFWHLDLSRDAWTIIDIVADRYSAKGLNTTITDYFECHYVFLLSFVKDIIAYLPDEDQFFVELFVRAIMGHVRQKVCFQRQQIRAGIVTPEEVRALIPRRDLKLAAIKQKYRDRADSMPQEGHDIEHPKGIEPSTIS